MSDQNISICAPDDFSIKINKWKVREGFQVSNGNVILLYELTDSADTEIKRLKATKCGVVRKRLKKDGEIACKGFVEELVCVAGILKIILLFLSFSEVLLYLSECNHTTVIKDMCADCGADLRQNDEVIMFIYSILLLLLFISPLYLCDIGQHVDGFHSNDSLCSRSEGY